MSWESDSAQSPLYDATTTYPGPPPDAGQIVDTNQRAEFNAVRANDWHTPLNPPQSSGIVWIQFLEFNNGDWALAGGVPVVNINTLSNNFAFILNSENPANSTVPIILTDYVTAFDPSSGSCCILGFHNAQPGNNPPGGVLIWAWATFLPQDNDPFGASFADITPLSHEVTELYNDPFVNNNVAPWVDGSVQFQQANLETGDAIEAMADADSIYPVDLNPNGNAYTYHPQNEALLAWFTRNPLNGGLYSWPNTHTLSQSPHPDACTLASTLAQPLCWSYGEGSAGFFFGPPY